MSDLPIADHFDVFLSHNSRDKPAVIALAKKLKAQGLKVWLDVWELRPGQPWQEALEQIIETTQTAVVLVGGDGFGPWEDVEMRACLNEFVRRKLPVVPVLLSDCPKKPNLSLLLRAFTWVDLRDGKEETGFYNLMWGITGERPKELDEDADSFLVPALQRGNAEHDAPASPKPAPTAKADQDAVRRSGQDGVPTQGAWEREQTVSNLGQNQDASTGSRHLPIGALRGRYDQEIVVAEPRDERLRPIYDFVRLVRRRNLRELEDQFILNCRTDPALAEIAASQIDEWIKNIKKPPEGVHEGQWACKIKQLSRLASVARMELA